MINGGLIQEHDPIFSASPSASITNTDITNWNNKSDFSGSYNDLSNKPTIPSISNSYGTSTTDGYSQNYCNKYLRGVSLYDNSSGSNSSVTLSETSANFSFLEIYFRSNDATSYTSYQKVYSPNGKYTPLRYELKSGGGMYIKITQAKIAANKITLENAMEYYFAIGNNNTINASSTSNIYITKVIGYK